MSRASRLLAWIGAGASLAVLLLLVVGSSGEHDLRPFGMLHEAEIRSSRVAEQRVIPRSENEPPQVIPAQASDDTAIETAVGARAVSAVRVAREPNAANAANAAEVMSTEQRGAPAERPLPDIADLPRNWCFSPDVNHDVASDTSTIWDGSRSVVIGTEQGTNPRSGLDTLWQAADATRYRGLRAEFSAYIRAETSGDVVIFLDAKSARESTDVAFETNPLAIAKFSVSGPDWTRLGVVAAVPANAETIFYGVSYSGSTRLWVDDAGIAVGTDLPVTQKSPGAAVFFAVNFDAVLPTPTNLSFELTKPGLGREEACRRVTKR